MRGYFSNFLYFSGEKIGLEYLLAQTNQNLQAFDTETDETLNEDTKDAGSYSADEVEEDEGYEETFFEEDQTQPPLLLEQISGRPASESKNKLQTSRPSQDRIQEQSEDQVEPRVSVKFCFKFVMIFYAFVT